MPNLALSSSSSTRVSADRKVSSWSGTMTSRISLNKLRRLRRDCFHWSGETGVFSASSRRPQDRHLLDHTWLPALELPRLMPSRRRDPWCLRKRNCLRRNSSRSTAPNRLSDPSSESRLSSLVWPSALVSVFLVVSSLASWSVKSCSMATTRVSLLLLSCRCSS